MRVAITAAAGKTGTAVGRALREYDVDVLPLVHRPRGLDRERVVELGNAAEMYDALAAVDALYLIAPNVHADEPGLLSASLAACAQRGVRVLYHSVMHPYSPAMPHHLDKAHVEDALHRSDLNWTIVQPASYADNVLGPLRAIGAEGVWPVPYDVDAPFTPIALADLAAIASTLLRTDGHRSATYEIAGPDRISTAEMAQVAEQVLGRQITARRDREPWRRAVGTVLPDHARDRLERMFDYYDLYGFCGGSAVARQLLGHEPMSFQQWAADNVRVPGDG